MWKTRIIVTIEHMEKHDTDGLADILHNFVNKWDYPEGIRVDRKRPLTIMVSHIS